MTASTPTALAIAGLDPSGGAGLLLDAFVFARLGYAPTTVASTITAQNSADFFGAQAVETELLAKELRAVLAERAVACVKVGAVGSGENVRLLAREMAKLSVPVVVDPVLTSSSGGNLTSGADARDLDELCAAATVVTPNAEEAARLAGAADAPSDIAAAGENGRTLAIRWGCTVIVTGLPAEYVRARGVAAIDLLCTAASVEPFPHPLVPGVGDVRGTGCMFSTALAAELGHGLDPRSALSRAQEVVAELLGHAIQLGTGRMQIDLAALATGER